MGTVSTEWISNVHDRIPVFENAERWYLSGMPEPRDETNFDFRYALLSARATLTEGQLIIKMGIKTIIVPMATLEQLHVHCPRGAGHQELLLAYRTGRGKLKRARAFADAEQPGFDGLIRALLDRRPEIDRRGLTQQQAWVEMGSKPAVWYALPLVMVAAWLLIAGLFTPMWIHGFDTGHVVLDADEIHGETVDGTRNLTVLGTLKADYSTAVKVAADDKLDTSTYRIALVGGAWRPGDPVRVVVEARGLKGDGLDQLMAAERFDGVLRNIWWEGLDEATFAALKEKGATIAPDAQLLQLGADSTDDRTIAFAVLAALALVIAAVTLSLRPARV